jgi:dTDP-4-dehydrorhamnose 3,5-epimerase
VRALPTTLHGPVLIEPSSFRDERGFFLETYRRDAYAEVGVTDDFVQQNQSRSGRGVLRGMHFSVDPGQAKLVRVARGAIWDVVVDIRHGSPTWGRWEGFTLDEERLLQLYVPLGFAHGFCVLSEVADVLYGCSSYYDGDRERGFAWDDPDVGVQWPVTDPLVSGRDAAAPRLRDIAAQIPFRWRPAEDRSTAASSSER